MGRVYQRDHKGTWDMRWYIEPKDWFENKEQYDFVVMVAKMFNAQEIRGVDHEQA